MAVLVKQVPASQSVKMGQDGILVRDGDLIVNPDDLHAIEAALAIKERHGGSITAISMGPPQAKDALIEEYDGNTPTGVKKTVQPWVIELAKKGMEMVTQIGGTAAIEFEGDTNKVAG
ncbi:MAG: hypothetical protein GYA24_18095, partial [Candidatus Lokiarchaeota archaeon]|nr:hypothetical protein [Candidatus Lokiarchaeota archaeon]